MSDNYQAVFDAVRSRMGNCDVGAAVQEAFSLSNFGHYASMAANAAIDAANEHGRPSAVFRPTLSLDGDQWMALLGRNLHEGLAGFGSTPDAAMRAFDVAWHQSTQKKAA